MTSWSSFLFATANFLSESLLVLSCLSTFPSFLLVDLAESTHKRRRNLLYCIVFFTNFALRHFVDDLELGDVTVSLLTLQEVRILLAHLYF